MNNVVHQQRVPGCLDEARRRGAEVIEVNPADEDFSTQRSRKIVPALVIDPPDDCWLMQEEIFGPVLPLRTYRTQEEVIAYSNARPRPLALYCFGDRIGAARILESTISRGAAVDDVLVHALEPNLPFGGSGSSGMGGYHGKFGFTAFGQAKAVYRGMRLDPMAALRPPCGKWTCRALGLVVKRWSSAISDSFRSVLPLICSFAAGFTLLTSVRSHCFSRIKSRTFKISRRRTTRGFLA